MHKQLRSFKVFQNLCQVIPGGVNSPVRACKGLLDTPLVAERGEGDMIYDADGNGYIDYCGSWGSLIHGHAHPTILDAVSRRMAKGTSFGITTEIEEKLARKIVDRIDSLEKVRFVSSGTEATMSAARLARGYTGKELIIKYQGNYHGHADFFLVNAGSGLLAMNSTASSAGIPDDIVKHTVSLRYNDVEETRAFLQKHGDRVAAVILEPIAGNMGVIPASQSFVDMLREETSAVGALLIFDEVINGFRVGQQGAQGLYGVKPDLTCFGKIIGGGFPVAAFGGRADIMDKLAPLGTIYQAGTLSGNPVAMEAGYQALTLLEENDFFEELERKTNLITKPIQKYFEEKSSNACIQQVGSMFTLFFGQRYVKNMDDVKKIDADAFAKMFRFLFSRGIYPPPSPHEAWFVSMAHTDEHLLETRDLILAFLDDL